MSTIIILGDVHLGKSTSIGKVGIGSALNSRVIDQVNLLDWTLDQALDNGAENIIVTGDVFEEPKPHPSLITLYISWLKKCDANGVRVHTIMGNHDILRTGNFYTSPLDIVSECEIDNALVYKDVDTIYIGNAAFTLMPFRDRKSFNVATHGEALTLLKDSLVYELASIPMIYRKIIVGHLAIEGSIPVGDEIDDISNELFCPIDMFNGYDYVWMGHVHKPQVMSASKAKTYVAHIGSMDISNFGESEQKKHIIVLDLDKEESKECIFEQVTLPTRPLRKITISVPVDTKDTTKYVKEEVEKNKKGLLKSILRLEVHLTSPDLIPIDRSAVEKYLYSLGVFNVSAISESKKLAPIKKDESKTIDTTMDIISAIKTYASSHVDEKKRNSFTALASDIYNQFKNESKD